MNASGPVPVIDIGLFESGPEDREQLARSVDAACRELGFMIISNHGLEAQVVTECWNRAAEFFDSPLANRRTATADEPGHPYGYHGFAAEALAQSLDEATPPDLKETFNVGPLELPGGNLDPQAAAFAFASNHWPVEPAGFRDALEDYYRALRGLSDRVMEIFAAALGLPRGFFAESFKYPMSALRVINYPELEQPPEPGQLRAGAHTDYGTLTLLLQQPDRSGLQVLSRGDWHDVPAIPDTFVVNIGDLMARWTNDRWVSTLHRVVNPAEAGNAPTRRQSLVFFHTPSWNADIRCIPTCLPEQEQPIHAPVMAGPHLAGKFYKTVR